MILKHKKIVFAFLQCLFLSGCADVIISADDPMYFPMIPGIQWMYDTHSTVCLEGGIVVTNTTETICAVIDTYTKAGITAARLRGFPFGMDVWSGGTNIMDEILLVCIPASQYHMLETTAVDRFADPNDFLLNLVNEKSLILDCPLVAGKRFGEYEQLTRSDRNYSWNVESEQHYRIRGITGVSPWATRTVYNLIYRTLSDVQRVVFVPGIGIIEYEYHHNGTPCDFRMLLKEFRKPD